MAKKVRIKARVSFNEVVIGDESTVELTPRIQGWIDAGLVEVVTDGPSMSRPRRSESDTHNRDPEGTGGGISAGRESGEGFGAGGYGASAGQHPS